MDLQRNKTSLHIVTSVGYSIEVISSCIFIYKAVSCPEGLVGELYSTETNLVSHVQSSSPSCNIHTGVSYWLLKQVHDLKKLLWAYKADLVMTLSNGVISVCQC